MSSCVANNKVNGYTIVTFLLLPSTSSATGALSFKQSKTAHYQRLQMLLILAMLQIMYLIITNAVFFDDKQSLIGQHL